MTCKPSTEEHWQSQWHPAVVSGALGRQSFRRDFTLTELEAHVWKQIDEKTWVPEAFVSWQRSEKSDEEVELLLRDWK